VADVTHARATGVGSGIFGAFDARYLYLISYASYQTHSLNHPTGIAITPPGGGSGNIYTGLYIVDSANNVIKLLQDWSHTLVTVAGNRTAGYVDGSISQAEFHAPTGIGSVSVGE